MTVGRTKALGKHAKKAKRLTPYVVIRCTQAAKVKLTGTITEVTKVRKTRKVRRHTKTIKLSARTLTVATKPVKVTLSLSKRVLRALEHRAKETLALKFTSSNAHGSSTTTTKFGLTAVK